MGRTLRLLVGLLLTVEISRHLTEINAGLASQMLGIAVGLFLFYALLHFLVSRHLRGLNPCLGAVLAVMPTAFVYALGGGPGKLGSVLFIGISLILASVRADGGCEVMAIPDCCSEREPSWFASRSRRSIGLRPVYAVAKIPPGGI